MRCGLYKISKIKMCDSIGTKTNRVDMEVNCYKFLIISLEMIYYYLKITCDKLNMYILNPKASPKITE